MLVGLQAQISFKPKQYIDDGDTGAQLLTMKEGKANTLLTTAIKKHSKIS